MENASKALIIAGAILISILLIAVGVMVLNNGMDMAKDSNLSEEQVQKYNQPYTNYGGSNVSGAQAAALCEKVRSHNLSVEADDVSKLIEVVGTEKSDEITDGGSWDAPAAKGTIATSPTTVKNSIRSGYTYKIHFNYDARTGLVTKISIIKN